MEQIAHVPRHRIKEINEIVENLKRDREMLHPVVAALKKENNPRLEHFNSLLAELLDLSSQVISITKNGITEILKADELQGNARKFYQAKVAVNSSQASFEIASNTARFVKENSEVISERYSSILRIILDHMTEAFGVLYKMYQEQAPS